MAKGDKDIYGAGTLLDRLKSDRAVIDAQSPGGGEEARVEEASSKSPPKMTQRRRSTTATPAQSKKKPKEEKPVKRTQISLYINPELLKRLDRRVIDIRHNLGRKRDRSGVIEEAIEAWLDSQ